MEQLSDIYIYPSPEIQELLADNNINLADLLKQEGVDITSRLGTDPTGDKHSKDSTTILMASAAVALALTPILYKVINALTHKTVVVRELVLVPVEDSQGNILKDDDGVPILHWERRTRLLESREAKQEDTSMSLKAPLGFELTFSSSTEN